MATVVHTVPYSALGSGIYCERRPLLMGFHVARRRRCERARRRDGDVNSLRWLGSE